MPTYFRLNPECYLVNGARRAAIYNLMSGQLIWLESAAAAFVRACELGDTTEAAVIKSGLTKADATDLITRLLASGTGLLFDQPVYVEHWRDRRLWKVKQFYEDPPVLQMAFLELTGTCNLDCSFCQPSRTIRQWTCAGCMRRPLRRPSMAVADWTRVLRLIHTQ